MLVTPDIPLASEHLVVGETYLVPCINGTPVIGDLFADRARSHCGEDPVHAAREYDRAVKKYRTPEFARLNFR